MTLSPNFRMRLIYGLIALFVLIIATYLSSMAWFQPFYVLLFAAMLGTTLWEYGHIARAKGFRPLIRTSIVCSTFYVCAIYLKATETWAWMLPELILVGSLAACFLYYFTRGKDVLVNLAITFFGIVYLTVPLSCLLSITFMYGPNAAQDGRLWMIYLISIAKLTDTGAYFAGKQFGRHKLAPYISPKKTWEGAFGGLLTGILASVVIGILMRSYFTHPPLSLSLWESIFLGSMLSIIAQFGDLTESLLKRDAGVKDSNQLPGLGGALDLVDSLIFTSPLLYLYLQIQ